MGIFERGRQQLGNRRHTVSQWQVFGDVAGFVSIDERQIRLRLDRHRFDDDSLQIHFFANVFGQHQFDEAVLFEAGLQQLDELGVVIGRRLDGRGSNGHEKAASDGRNREWRVF
ncbi:hypothetical protein D3C87_1117160 [compost metagenome]